MKKKRKKKRENIEILNEEIMMKMRERNKSNKQKKNECKH